MPHELHAEGLHFSAGSALSNSSRHSGSVLGQVGTESPSEVPTHIKGLLDDIRINAPPGVRDEAVQLITQYSDVFAVSDLDLGEFTAIEHYIETGEAWPVKHACAGPQRSSKGRRKAI